MLNIIYAAVAAVIGLGILIIIHELGHFLVAKKTGVGVLTFSIGFGPKLFRKRIGETEYAVSALPLGGYVKMVGEDPDEEVKEIDVQKSFSHQGLWKRTAIVAAGPLFNLLLAVAIFIGIFLAYGVRVHNTTVAGVAPDSPAAAAGIEKGDKVVAIDGAAISKWDELATRIQRSGGNAVLLRIERGEREMEISVRPARSEGRNIFGEKQDDWRIGITGEAAIERSDPLLAVGQAFYETGRYSALTLVALYKMVNGDISPKNLGGPLLIAQMAGQQAREGLANFFYFLAILSINLGVLNFLPIPVLDGGHLFFFLVEGIIGRPLELKHRERAQQVGMVLLILVMIYAFYNDIVRFFE